MKKLQFPSAHTILLIIAAFVAISTWLIPSGKFDTLGYDKEQKEFIQKGEGEDKIFPASQETLDQLGIKIPLEKFTSGDIWKPVGIPGTYHELKANPQGFKAFIQSPLQGIVKSIDVILFVLIIGGFIGVVNHTGAFDAGVGWLATNLKGRETLLIILITSFDCYRWNHLWISRRNHCLLPYFGSCFSCSRL